MITKYTNRLQYMLVYMKTAMSLQDMAVFYAIKRYLTNCNRPNATIFFGQNHTKVYFAEVATKEGDINTTETNLK